MLKIRSLRLAYHWASEAGRAACPCNPSSPAPMANVTSAATTSGAQLAGGLDSGVWFWTARAMRVSCLFPYHSP